MTDFENKTLEELKQYCRDNNIRGFSRKKKLQLIDLIKKYRKNSSEDNTDKEKEVIINEEEIIKNKINDNISLYIGDCIKIMMELENESIDLIITSPPYWGQRDYKNDNNGVMKMI